MIAISADGARSAAKGVCACAECIEPTMRGLGLYADDFHHVVGRA
jgi:hypothetical protein